MHIPRRVGLYLWLFVELFVLKRSVRSRVWAFRLNNFFPSDMKLFFLLTHTILSTGGSRAFAVAAPHIWNTLPTDVRQIHCRFRRLLKRFLFKQSYPDIS